MVFLFSAARPFISGNHTHVPRKNSHGRIMTKAARSQAEYIARTAAQAVLAANWAMPDYCYVEVVGMNVDADGDNLEKPLLDPMQGHVFFSDRRIKERRIIDMRDKGPSRIIVAVQEVDGKAYGYRKPSRKKA
jgi:Holliday junction resolvase RusA-like endonuclease